MNEMWVQSLSWEYPMEEEMATHSSILAWIILQTEHLAGPLGHKESDTTDTFIFMKLDFFHD